MTALLQSQPPWLFAETSRESPGRVGEDSIGSSDGGNQDGGLSALLAELQSQLKAANQAPRHQNNAFRRWLSASDGRAKALLKEHWVDLQLPGYFLRAWHE